MQKGNIKFAKLRTYKYVQKYKIKELNFFCTFVKFCNFVELLLCY